MDPYLMHGEVELSRPRAVVKLPRSPTKADMERWRIRERLYYTLNANSYTSKQMWAKMFVRSWAIASGKKIPESQDGLVFWCIQPED